MIVSSVTLTPHGWDTPFAKAGAFAQEMAMTLDELRKQLYNHKDAGVAMRVSRAIGELIKEEKFTEAMELTLDTLGELRTKLYALKPDLGDLFGALGGKGSGNPGEAALQYVEGLMRSLPKPTK